MTNKYEKIRKEKMKLIYGTHNPGKFKGMVKAVEGLNLELQSLDSLGIKLEEATESGGDPLSNAVEKAKYYIIRLKCLCFLVTLDFILKR